MNRDPHVVAVAGQRLVDRVVDDLVDEVVQAAYAGRADVHPRALAHRLEALEDGDVLGVVVRALLAVVHVVARQRDAFRLHTRRPGGTESVHGRGVPAI